MAVNTSLEPMTRACFWKKCRHGESYVSRVIQLSVQFRRLSAGSRCSWVNPGRVQHASTDQEVIERTSLPFPFCTQQPSKSHHQNNKSLIALKSQPCEWLTESISQTDVRVVIGLALLERVPLIAVNMCHVVLGLYKRHQRRLQRLIRSPKDFINRLRLYFSVSVFHTSQNASSSISRILPHRSDYVRNHYGIRLSQVSFHCNSIHR
jgi:hypothetical protein